MDRLDIARAVALGTALVMLLLTAQPVMGAELVKDEGRTGYSEIQEPGGRCSYDSVTNKLRSIRAFKPTVYGDYAPGMNTWVAWRLKVLRAPNDLSTNQVIYQSPWQKDRANDQLPADGFARIDWAAPANPDGLYKIHIMVVFYRPGSKTNVEGKTVWEPDSYWLRNGNNLAMGSGRCVAID